jgi:hypothetical protein
MMAGRSFLCINKGRWWDTDVLAELARPVLLNTELGRIAKYLSEKTPVKTREGKKKKEHKHKEAAGRHATPHDGEPNLDLSVVICLILERSPAIRF